MKRYLFIPIESALSLIMLSMFVWLCVVELNILNMALSLFGSLYFIDKVVLGVKLIVDIIEGPNEKDTIFMGTLKAEHLDFFTKTYFSYVYFDDSVLTKNYRLFSDIYSTALHSEDSVTIKYYKRSRIILQLSVNNPVTF